MAKNNGKEYQVVILKSSSESQNWNDGLFAIRETIGDVYCLQKIVNGELKTYEDKSPCITCTSINNRGLKFTKLVIND
jgi:hypothetical protein